MILHILSWGDSLGGGLVPSPQKTPKALLSVYPGNPLFCLNRPERTLFMLLSPGNANWGDRNSVVD